MNQNISSENAYLSTLIELTRPTTVLCHILFSSKYNKANTFIRIVFKSLGTAFKYIKQEN